MRGYANLFANVGVCLSVFLHCVLLEEDSSSPESLSCSAVEPPAKRSKTSAYAERPVQSGKEKEGKMWDLRIEILSSTQTQTDLYAVGIACCCSGKNANGEKINVQVVHVFIWFV